MSRNRKEDRNSFITSAGWLFADMLLALSMLFLVASTLGVKPTPPVHAHPVKPKRVTVTKTPTPKLRILESEYCRLVFTDKNPDQFSSDFQFAKSVLEPQVNAVRFLHGRLVGTAIAYGGVDDINSPYDRGRAIGVATMTYKVLRDDGRTNQTFKATSYYDPLFTGNSPFTSQNIVIDVYLVVRSNNPADTCNNKHNPVG